jgi:hypothetical protein
VLAGVPEWTEILDSERFTGALLDRLTHDVHILEMNGDSFRLKQSRCQTPRKSFNFLSIYWSTFTPLLTPLEPLVFDHKKVDFSFH